MRFTQPQTPVRRLLVGAGHVISVVSLLPSAVSATTSSRVADSPTQVHAQSVRAGVMLTWHGVSTSTRNGLQSYLVVDPMTSKNWWTSSKKSTVTLLLRGLASNTKYIFDIYSVNGVSSFSMPATSNPVVFQSAQPIANSGTCTVRQSCDLGPKQISFASFDNGGAGNLNDCSFAGAADWETVVLGTTLNNASLIDEYNTATVGTNTGPIVSCALDVLGNQGISGTFASGAESIDTHRSNIQRRVLESKAVIAQLRFNSLDQIGNLTMAFAGSHFVVVDGFTPVGPRVVTWGSTVQMTWAQWNDEIVGSWKITSRPRSAPATAADAAASWGTWSEANRWAFVTLDVARATVRHGCLLI